MAGSHLRAFSLKELHQQHVNSYAGKRINWWRHLFRARRLCSPTCTHTRMFDRVWRAVMALDWIRPWFEPTPSWERERGGGGREWMNENLYIAHKKTSTQNLARFCCGMYWYMLKWHDDMIKSLSLLQALVFGDAILDAITLQQVDSSQFVNMRAES